MIFSRRIYFTILFHLLLILLTAGAGLWMILSHTGLIIGSLLLLCSLLQIGGLARQLNAFNRKIRLFFDAIEDRENMLYFPEQGGPGEQTLLNRSLNRINDLLAQTKTENQRQQHFYRSLLEEVPGGVLAWNASGQILVANSAALALLGDTLLANREQAERLLNSRENRRRLSISYKQMVLQEDAVTLVSIQDISDELTDKESESWSKLTHVLTHEIMNTIAPILSLSQTLSVYPDLPEKAARGLGIIRQQSERLLEFTDSFRHLSYLPHPEMKRFSLTALLHNLATLLHSDFEQREIDFALLCPPVELYVEADEKQLSQVFLNLLRNAMQALDGSSDRNGDVGSGSRSNITLCAERRNDRLLIEIADNGSGILPELQEQIFVPFFTTKSEGMGIGLSLCRQIIRQHRGHLTVKESRPGKTIFRIELP